MRRVGLTGGIASGKSTVAHLLRERHGIPVLDADQVARDVAQPGSPVLAAIAARFGRRSLAADGSLDRAALGAMVTADPEARAALDALTHPAIYAHIEGWLEKRRSQGDPVAVVEASLLVETGQVGRFDMLVVVTCAPETQIARLVAHRGMTEAQARSWLSAQAPLATKELAAGLLIRNDGDRAALEDAVVAALPRILGA
ncbi:MAG: dephospho-CoA kinase [Pseudomonadota bacterium]